MNIKLIDNSKFVIFLYTEKMPEINLDNKEQLENYFKSLFDHLHSIYSIDITGYYTINAYVDKNIGMALEIEKENIDYYDYLDNFIDMRIKIIKNQFIYELKDLNILSKIISQVDVYKYKQKIFISFKETINKQEKLLLSEFVDLIYNTEKIKRKLINIDKQIKLVYT